MIINLHQYISITFLDISLMDYLQSYEGGMPPDAVTYYFFQIAKGVKSFHAKDHVHGDIKISNCLLFDKGKTVKICDLDSVKEEETKQASGSRYYVDPEVHSFTFSNHVVKTIRTSTREKAYDTKWYYIIHHLFCLIETFS